MTTYTVDKLKAIGNTCSPSLPPASVMQQMLQYEMQQHSDTERLFHHQLIRLIRLDDHSKVVQDALSAQDEFNRKVEENIRILSGQSNAMDDIMKREVIKLSTHSDRLEHEAAQSFDGVCGLFLGFKTLIGRVNDLEHELTTTADRASTLEHKLAKTIDRTDALENQLATTVDRTNALEQQLATTTDRTNVLKHKHASAIDYTDILEYRLAAMMDSVQSTERDTAANSKAIDSLQACVDSIASSQPDRMTDELVAVGTRIDLLTAKLSLLFCERTANDQRITNIEESVDKLQDLMRCLTIQQQATKDESVKEQQVSRMPVTSPDKRLFELIVPKGSPFPASKENRFASKATEPGIKPVIQHCDASLDAVH